MVELPSLFTNSKDANLTSTVAVIEAVLEQLGHDAFRARVTRPGARRAWTFTKGSAEVHIDILERKDFLHLRVSSPIMTTDSADRSRLYERLLELNADHVVGAAFAIRNGEVLVIAERSTLDLDLSEAADLIRRVEDYADRYDDELCAAFGGHRGPRR